MFGVRAFHEHEQWTCTRLMSSIFDFFLWINKYGILRLLTIAKFQAITFVLCRFHSTKTLILADFDKKKCGKCCLHPGCCAICSLCWNRPGFEFLLAFEEARCTQLNLNHLEHYVNMELEKDWRKCLFTFANFNSCLQILRWGLYLVSDGTSDGQAPKRGPGHFNREAKGVWS